VYTFIAGVYKIVELIVAGVFVDNIEHAFACVSLTPVINLLWLIFPPIFVKLRNGPDGIDTHGSGGI
jgi:hypothetical protein